MSLTGGWTLVALIALALAVVVVTALCWNRIRGRGWLAWPARFGMLLVCQITACAAVAAAVNDSGQFYTSWHELFGQTSGVSIAHLPPGAEDRAVADQLRRRGRAGKSLVVSVLIPDADGTRAHPALVYLPAAYFSPAYADVAFPVIELLDGYPGGPQSWTHALRIQHVADGEIAADRTMPFLAVMPVQNYVGGVHDAECVNAVNGPQVETTLTTNVRTVIERDFRVQHDARAWSVMGYSIGGFCATNIAMRHPSMFGSAVSLSGYDKPYVDRSTGDIFDHRLRIQLANDPLWIAEHRPGPPVTLLLAATHQDRVPYTDAQELARAIRSPTRAYLLTLPDGGHNFATIWAMLPAALDWIARVLQTPLSVPVRVAGVGPVLVPDRAAPPVHSARPPLRAASRQRVVTRPRFQ